MRFAKQGMLLLLACTYAASAAQAQSAGYGWGSGLADVTDSGEQVFTGAQLQAGQRPAFGLPATQSPVGFPSPQPGTGEPQSIQQVSYDEMDPEILSESDASEPLLEDRGCCSACDACNPCCTCAGWVGGMGLVIMRPFISDSTAFMRTTPVARTNNGTSSVATTFTQQYEVTPRVWIGFVGRNGFGLRTQYWQFDHDPSTLSVTDLGPTEQYQANVFSSANLFSGRLLTADGQTLNVSSSLEAHTLELEGTYRGQFGRMQYTLGFGGRYVALKQGYLARIVNSQQVLGHNLNFDGLGPTFVLQGRLPLRFGFAAIGSTRLSTLFGARRETIFSFTQTDFQRKAEEVLPIVDLSMGGEWSRTLASGARLFAQTTVESSVWINGGNPQSDTNHLGFFGLGFMCGLVR